MELLIYTCLDIALRATIAGKSLYKGRWSASNRGNDLESAANPGPAAAYEPIKTQLIRASTNER
jgi:hypothetical protein